MHAAGTVLQRVHPVELNSRAINGYWARIEVIHGALRTPCSTTEYIRHQSSFGS